MGDYRPKPAPALHETAHKGDAGRLLCLAGSVHMPGAAILCARAAQRAGAGLVTLGIFHEELRRLVASASPETIFLDITSSKDLFAGRLPLEVREHAHDARVAGPGLGTSGHSRELVRRLVSSEFTGPMVLDADALNVVGPALEALADFSGQLVLTPHPGEAGTLLDRDVPASDEGRLGCAREIAEGARCITVLKGARTVVTDGERTYVNTTGGPGMATAGSGDVLTGILGAYLAQCANGAGEDWDVFDAVCAAVHVHGLAGDLTAGALGARGSIASDQIESLPAAQVAFAQRDS